MSFSQLELRNNTRVMAKEISKGRLEGHPYLAAIERRLSVHDEYAWTSFDLWPVTVESARYVIRR